ncbi:division/cell wall cluster transcriptional repressor MraZ [Atribacter laminatus]|uniref:Transcriptional regulator MraZ n=1 Tax=Atribacter laminatus TaxID=2847778 RepID=A0A7T1F275_ATRLM|nr:division/cell wall cluster transcriptional repressor MraZ [Atribacter laminatus]QPM66940.1 Transcriptional regulator MraZ [Atribacter laminatus]
MLLGQYRHSVDNKGRLIIPNEFRKDLSNTLYVTKGIENCVFVFSETTWQVLAGKIASLPMAKKAGREFARIFLANASEETIDAQGRITIPRHLREYAEIDKKVVTVGIGERMEIWSESLWDQHAAEVEGKYEDITEEIMDTGI